MTFNYDRLLEHYLTTAMAATYAAPPGAIAAYLHEDNRIVHMYGQLGGFPDSRHKGRRVDARPFSTSAEAKEIKIAANGIHLVGEERVSENLEAAKAFLEDAQRVVFLGFGYDAENVGRLSTPKGWEHHHSRGFRVFGSCFGMRGAETVRESVLSNPLMREVMKPPQRSPEIQRLYDAIVLVLVTSKLLAEYVTKAGTLWDRRGPPEPGDFPDRAPQRNADEETHRQAAIESAAARGEDLSNTSFGLAQSQWVRLLEDLERAYREWCGRIHDAQNAVPAVRATMNAGEARRPEQWTVKILGDLNRLAAMFHPVRVGADGMGILRRKPVVPDEFGDVLVALSGRQNELHSSTAVGSAKWNRKPSARGREKGTSRRQTGKTRRTKSARTERLVRADEASRASGLSADAIRKRAKRLKWRIKTSGKMNCYRLEDLKRAWPHKQFISDNGGK